MTGHFNLTQNLFLSGTLVFIAGAVVSHIKSKEGLSILLLLLAGFCMFSVAALLDPFLNLWDERFHALVAKNMMKHPFMPMLYDDPVVDMAYDRWDRYHIWLHKQPLFLWQIALSFKLFGISEFALRLPNVLMGTAMVYAFYRSGTLLVNKNTGFLAALFLITTVYFVELAAGRQELEHNDFSFMAYVSLSIWTFLEYRGSGKKRWVILTGVFSGFAILCKWLPGLLVFLGWAVHSLYERNFSLRRNRELLLAFLIAVAIALPWQVYTFLRFPQEAAGAYRFNALHFTVPLDGHRGTIWYHFDQFNLIYGALASYFIFPAFLILYLKMGKQKRGAFLSLAVMTAWVYIFYTAAATKMPSFTTIAVLPVSLAFAGLLEWAIAWTRKIFSPLFGQLVFFLMAMSFFIYHFDLGQVRQKHSLVDGNNQYSQMLSHNREVFKSLDLPANTVLFNVKGRHYIDAMFYTGLPAYNFVPSKEQFEDIKRKGREIALFVNTDTELPAYLLNDPQVTILPFTLQGYD